MAGKRIELIGDRYGRWTVMSEGDRYEVAGKSRGRRWHVRCDCGTEALVLGRSLRSGVSASCGCLQKEKVAAACRRRATHGDARVGKKASEYNIRRAMIARCENPKTKFYQDYGGRGIEVCGRWRDGEAGLYGYECFLLDMGRRPSRAHSIDRKNNDGNYEPGNCRWATAKEQRANQRASTIIDQ